MGMLLTRPISNDSDIVFFWSYNGGGVFTTRCAFLCILKLSALKYEVNARKQNRILIHGRK